jgi:hypothetical protein
MDITADINNCNRLISRSLGNKKTAIYIVYSTDIYNRFIYIINDYIKIMSDYSDYYKNSYLTDLNDRTNRLFKVGLEESKGCAKTFDKVVEKVKEENKEEYLELLNLITEISEVIYDKLTSNKVESIEDLEVVSQKISSIRNVLKSDRYESSFFNYVVDGIYNNYISRAADRLTGYNIDELTKSLKRIKYIISKL